MSDVIEIGETANGGQIELRLRQTLRITLSEAQTAGFRWNLRALTEGVCALIKEDREPPPGPAGGAGNHAWELRAEAVGSVEILIEYRRPWERTTAPARSFSISVRVA